MNTENSTEPTPSQNAGKPVPKPDKAVNKTGGGLAWPGLLLALIATGLAAYTYIQLTALRMDTSVTDQMRQQDARLDQLQERLESLGGMINEMQTGIAGMDQVQTENAEALRRLAGSIAIDNLDLALAEVEQLLIMATHNLTLQHNVTIALAALEAADRRLAGLNIPELQTIRAQLAADMNALRSVNTVDTAGLSLYLADLSGRITRLPLNRVQVLDETTAISTVDDAARPVWQRLLLSIWQEFKGMFIVTRVGSNAKATLLPDESWFLYQNLRLQIETARLAVIRQDTETLQSALQQLTGWLTDYFDTSDSGVANILETANKMAALDLDPELPDISSSLESLRVFIKSRAAVDMTVEPAAP